MHRHPLLSVRWYRASCPERILSPVSAPLKTAETLLEHPQLLNRGSKKREKNMCASGPSKAVHMPRHRRLSGILAVFLFSFVCGCFAVALQLNSSPSVHDERPAVQDRYLNFGCSSAACPPGSGPSVLHPERSCCTSGCSGDAFPARENCHAPGSGRLPERLCRPHSSPFTPHFAFRAPLLHFLSG